MKRIGMQDDKVCRLAGSEREHSAAFLNLRLNGKLRVVHLNSHLMACGDSLSSFKEMPSLSGVEGDFERNISKNHLEKLNTDVVKIDLLA